MVRYIMFFTVAAGQKGSAQQIIDSYFEELYTSGPAGMRSQCYADHDDDLHFIHIKSFKRESIANQHFRSAIFKSYIQKLAAICGTLPSFSKLTQQQSFESIY